MACGTKKWFVGSLRLCGLLGLAGSKASGVSVSASGKRRAGRNGRPLMENEDSVQNTTPVWTLPYMDSIINGPACCQYHFKVYSKYLIVLLYLLGLGIWNQNPGSGINY